MCKLRCDGMDNLLLFFLQFKEGDMLCPILVFISKKEDVDCCHNLSVNSLMNWDYCEESECGPKYWPNANGRNQSPINLDLSLIKHSIMSPLKFLNYDMKLKGEIINNGHSVQVTLRFGSNAPEIQGGGFDQAYRLVQYHLHWGLHDNEGSEHTLAGLHYPAELHLVHEGITNPNKIAVIGVFFMLGDDDKALHQECVVLNKIIDPAKSEAVQEILLDDKLPKNRKSFWRYSGSLTTPPCSEVVTWTIFTEPIVITKFQLSLFRSLRDKTGRVMKNFRPVQKLYDRELQLVVTD
ncbi:putative carbonic anhydrase [Dirofilaria immitis]